MNFRYNFVYLLPAIMLSSCIEPISVESNEDLPIVVQCVLKHEPEQTLKLYHMRGLYSTEDRPVKDAQVYLVRHSGGVRDTVKFTNTSGGVEWKAGVCPEYDTDYELLVRIPGREDITATTHFPKDIWLTMTFRELHDGSGLLEPLPDVAFIESIWPNIFEGSWPGSITEWYGPTVNRDTTYYRMYTAELFQRKSINENEVCNDACKMWIYPHTKPESNGNWRVKFVSTQPKTKYAVTDHPGADDFNVVPGTVSDLEWEGLVPFGGVKRLEEWTIPPFRIGKWVLAMCPDLPLHDGFIRIDHPANFNNGITEQDFKKSYLNSSSSFLIYADYAQEFPKIDNTNGHINEVHFVSDEYDAYLRGLYVQHMNRNDFILSTYEISNIYSNICGGVGIFGADYATWDLASWGPAKNTVRL